jgi:hypothetical protein
MILELSHQNSRCQFPSPITAGNNYFPHIEEAAIHGIIKEITELAFSLSKPRSTKVKGSGRMKSN